MDGLPGGYVLGLGCCLGRRRGLVGGFEDGGEGTGMRSKGGGRRDEAYCLQDIGAHHSVRFLA